MYCSPIMFHTNGFLHVVYIAYNGIPIYMKFELYLQMHSRKTDQNSIYDFFFLFHTVIFIASEHFHFDYI